MGAKNFRAPRGYLSYPWKIPAGILVAPGYPPNIGLYQCWAGIVKKHTRGCGYLSNQERLHGYGYGYDICSGILARVEFNTRAIPAEGHGCIHICQNPYPRVVSVSNTRGGVTASQESTVSSTREEPPRYCLQKITRDSPCSAPHGPLLTDNTRETREVSHGY